MDEMEITNLHKRNKARKTPQPKKAPNSPKSDEPKKRSSDGKGSLERQEKEQLERPHSLKKHQSQLSLLVIQAIRKKKKSLKKSQAMKKYHTAEKSTKVT